MTEQGYKAAERMYLNAEGKVVGDDSPDKLTLLVAEGGTIPADRARELGLVGEEEVQPEPEPLKVPEAEPVEEAEEADGDAGDEADEEELEPAPKAEAKAMNAPANTKARTQAPNRK